MKKGFTLVEMMTAVLILIGILLIAVPTIINQVDKRKEQISEATLNMIYLGTKQYLDDYNIVSQTTIGSDFCVSLDKLVSEEYLQSPIIDPLTKKEISLTKYVKATLNPNREFTSFELTDTNCNLN